MRGIWLSVALFFSLLPTAGATPPFPTLNVQLQFVCLTINDSRLGGIEVNSLGQLPLTASEESLRVTTTWQTGTAVAISEIRDEAGNVLYVEEAIASRSDCESVPQNLFQLIRERDEYNSRFCITQVDQSLPSILVSVRLLGVGNAPPDALRDRIAAIGLCSPGDGLMRYQATGRIVFRTQ